MVVLSICKIDSGEKKGLALYSEAIFLATDPAVVSIYARMLTGKGATNHSPGC